MTIYLCPIGIPSSIHMGGGPPQYGNIEDMVSRRWIFVMHNCHQFVEEGLIGHLLLQTVIIWSTSVGLKGNLCLCPFPLWQGVGGGRAKRYSSQRQRPVPEPAPMHIGLMEGHYYEPSMCHQRALRAYLVILCIL